MSKLILPGSPEFNDPFGDLPQDGESAEDAPKEHPNGPAPVGAVDAQMAIYGPSEKYDWAGDIEDGPEDALPEQYREIQNQLGLWRVVLHQPIEYGFDNACLITALEELRLGPDGETRECAKALAAISPETSESELLELIDAGCTGGRFHMIDGEEILKWEDLDRLAWLFNDHNWVVSLNMDGRYFQEVEQRVQDWPGPVLIENMGGFPEPIRQNEPGFRALLRLIDRDGVWVSMAGWENMSATGGPHYEDIAEIAQGLMNWAPERAVWGSAWPSAAVDDESPDYLELLKVFRNWCGSDARFEAALIANAEELFGFPAIGQAVIN